MRSSGLLTFFLAISLLASAVCAHPEVFADASVRVLFDANGLAGVENHWVFDEEYSAATMSSVDADENGRLSAPEIAWLNDAVLGPYAKRNYFNYVQFGTEFLEIKKIKDFKATFAKGRLSIDFVAVCSAPVTEDWGMLVVVVSDPSNYIQLTTDMEKAAVKSHKKVEVEHFTDKLDGLTLFRAFRSEIQGIFLRFRKK